MFTKLRSQKDAYNLLERLFDEHSSNLFRFAYSLLQNSDDAEDAISEVFSKLAKDINFISKAENPAAYLNKCVRNACYLIMRNRKFEAPQKEQSCYNKDDLELQFALLQLPVEQREVVYYKIVEGLSFADIAIRLKIPAGTTSSRYRYAIEKLASILEDNYVSKQH